VTPFDPDEVAAIAARGEGRQVEFKEGLAADGRAARTICAFANTRGGVLLVGVSDRGALRGAARPAAVVAGLVRLAKHAIAPPVPVRTGAVRLGRATVVWCSVPLSPARPHAVLGAGPGGADEVVVRVGSSNRAAEANAAPRVRPAGGGRRPGDTRRPPDPLEARILAALADSAAGMTAHSCARALALGKQRARQVLERLEHAGQIIAHGLGDRRTYEVA
jgi:hypothetical protein